MSHRNTLTGNVGTLIPILTEEVVPNTRCHLKTSFSVKMPPLASETFANIDYRIEAFFVPTRLLVNGFTDIACGRNKLLPVNEQSHLPLLRLRLDASTGSHWNQIFGPGSLADYLGFKSPKFSVPTDSVFYEDITPLPFLAYHKIYDYWYRNKLVQKEVFSDVENNSDGATTIFWKYARYYQDFYQFQLDPTNQLEMAQVKSNDGVSLFSLRQRNFDSDYFTTATLSPQLGNPEEVRVPVQQSEGTLTIAALRAANSLQQFSERNNLCGVDDVNYYKAMYGARLDYGVAQHPVCLGSCSAPVYVNGIFQSAGKGAQGETNNPYLTVGAQYGSASCNGIDVVIKDFTAMEPGYIMVLGSLVPKVSYSSGIRRYLKHHLDGAYGSDIANPILQNIGPQPIYAYETDGAMNNNMDNSVFGYQTRFAEWVTHPDEIHGQFVDGNTLESFVLQRNIEKATLNSAFLQIPTDYLNQILAVADTGSLSGFSYWVDMLHSWNVVSPIADFVIPSLQDPAYEHGHEVTIRKNGAPMV